MLRVRMSHAWEHQRWKSGLASDMRTRTLTHPPSSVMLNRTVALVDIGIVVEPHNVRSRLRPWRALAVHRTLTYPTSLPSTVAVSETQRTELQPRYAWQAWIASSVPSAREGPGSLRPWKPLMTPVGALHAWRKPPSQVTSAALFPFATLRPRSGFSPPGPKPWEAGMHKAAVAVLLTRKAHGLGPIGRRALGRRRFLVASSCLSCPRVRSPAESDTR